LTADISREQDFGCRLNFFHRLRSHARQIHQIRGVKDITTVPTLTCLFIGRRFPTRLPPFVRQKNWWEGTVLLK